MGGYAFGTRPGIDAFALAQALGVSMPGARAVSSPRVSSEGTFTTGPGETGSVGPAIGQGTASAEAQGVAGRSALAADLASNMGVANNALSLMGLLGGPLANIAQQGLKAAMTAHNAVALAQAFESLTPAQRSGLTVDQQFALAQPQPIAQTLASFFGLGPLAIADPLGQKETQAFQAQRQGERSLTPNAPDPTAPPRCRRKGSARRMRSGATRPALEARRAAARPGAGRARRVTRRAGT